MRFTREQADALTQTGPGTPCGTLLRASWQPVALLEELKDGVPLAVRLLGEDLVLFRSGDGQIGLLARHCSHRGADLSFGRIEDGGLRCLYHGCLWSGAGKCLDYPPGFGDQALCDKAHQTAYPCITLGGLILAYLGPGEPPLPPSFHFLQGSADDLFATKVLTECNYLQAYEGNCDPLHHSYLHGFFSERNSPLANVGKTFVEDKAPLIHTESAPFGVVAFTARRKQEDSYFVTVTSLVVPNFVIFNGGQRDGFQVHWHVPIDDTNHWKYVLSCERARGQRSKSDVIRDEIGDAYVLKRNKSNNYLQDRTEMSTTFSGMGYDCTQSHDLFAVEGQRPIQDITAEHLGPGDGVLMATRMRTLEAIEAVQRGEDPPMTQRKGKSDPLEGLAIWNGVIGRFDDWKSARQKLVEVTKNTPLPLKDFQISN